jgi:hypothetical protein
MAEYYIGNRSSRDDMRKVLGVDRLSILNGRMSETLRSLALKKGIQKTQAGKKLEFFAVTEEQLATLTRATTQTIMALKGIEWRPLITVDATKMVNAINTVNAKYSHRMDSATHRKYTKELEQAIEDSLHKIAEDKKINRPSQPKLADNPYKVGDLIVNNWRHIAPKEFTQTAYSSLRVAKVTKAYVWLERIGFKRSDIGVWSNSKSAKDTLNNVETFGNLEDQCWSNHGHFIPLEYNKFLLEWQPEVDYDKKLIRHRWDKIASKNYRTGESDTNIDNTARVGYCYAHEPNYN